MNCFFCTNSEVISEIMFRDSVNERPSGADLHDANKADTSGSLVCAPPFQGPVSDFVCKEYPPSCTLLQNLLDLPLLTLPHKCF